MCAKVLLRCFPNRLYLQFIYRSTFIWTENFDGIQRLSCSAFFPALVLDDNLHRSFFFSSTLSNPLWITRGGIAIENYCNSAFALGQLMRKRQYFTLKRPQSIWMVNASADSFGRENEREDQFEIVAAMYFTVWHVPLPTSSFHSRHMMGFHRGPLLWLKSNLSF